MASVSTKRHVQFIYCGRSYRIDGETPTQIYARAKDLILFLLRYPEHDDQVGKQPAFGVTRRLCITLEDRLCNGVIIPSLHTHDPVLEKRDQYIEFMQYVKASIAEEFKTKR